MDCGCAIASSSGNHASDGCGEDAADGDTIGAAEGRREPIHSCGVLVLCIIEGWGELTLLIRW